MHAAAPRVNPSSGGAMNSTSTEGRHRSHLIAQLGLATKEDERAKAKKRGKRGGQEEADNPARKGGQARQEAIYATT